MAFHTPHSTLHTPHYRMNRALWQKAVSDAWLHLAVSSLLLVFFAWIFVWLMSHFPTDAASFLLKWLSFLKPLMQVPIEMLASRAGQISVLYVHVVTVLVCIGWALGRGSHSISGEISRGTMDLLLSLPVWRVTVMVIPAVIATLGAAALAASVWLGTAIGFATVNLGEPMTAAQFTPGAVNLFAMTFCVTGVTTLISACSRDRWRTIALGGGFFIVSFIVEMMRRLWPDGWWLKYCTFLSMFQPQELILEPGAASAHALAYNATLAGLGLAAYVMAGIVLSRRDIPTAR
jgi:ABC-2 type transport system permease protein